MKINKNITVVALLFACLFFLAASSADAQKRRRSTRSAKPAATETAPTSSFEVKDGAKKVSIQIKNLTKFLYVLGGVAKGIEDIDKEAKARKVSRDILDKNAQFKQDVLQSMRNLRAGLAALEVEFRTKNGLKPYLFQIQGITDMSGAAEDQANAGRFSESGKTLLVVVEKLADTLAALP